MIPNLARYMNKTIFVSIPVLFEDTVCRPVRLLGAELNGLWLQSDELMERLTPEEPLYATPAAAVVFIPFAQMAAVLIHMSVPVQGTESKAPPEKSVSRASDESKRQGSVRSKGKKNPGSSEQR
jgi:hypothetical protein